MLVKRNVSMDRINEFFENNFKTIEMTRKDLDALHRIWGKEPQPCYGDGRHIMQDLYRLDAQRLGLYCKIHEPFIKKLAERIDGWYFEANVLEVGSGRGFLSAALSRHLDINEHPLYAADPWVGYRMDDSLLLYDTHKMGAREAILKFAADRSRYNLVLVAWPPYCRDDSYNVMNEIVDTVLKLQKEGVLIYIIYIGEPPYGCTGEESFWERNDYSMFEIDLDYRENRELPWGALNDRVYEIVP